MKRITLKFAIAMLTFLIGSVAASLLLLNRETPIKLHQSEAPADPPIILCDLVRNAEQYNSKAVRVRAFLISHHLIWLYDPSCGVEIRAEFDSVSHRKLIEAVKELDDTGGIRGILRANVVLAGQFEVIPKNDCRFKYCHQLVVSEVERVSAIAADVAWPK